MERQSPVRAAQFMPINVTYKESDNLQNNLVLVIFLPHLSMSGQLAQNGGQSSEKCDTRGHSTARH